MDFRKDQNNITSIYESLILRKNLKKSYLCEQQETPTTIKSNLTPDEWNEINNKIIKAKTIISIKDNYFYYILQQLNVLITTDSSIKTMAVDPEGNLYINAKFLLNEITLKETAAILAHETGHIWLDSFERLGNRDMGLWNVATDYIINMYLLEHQYSIPDWACVPIRNPQDQTRWIIPKYENLDITDLTAEQIYSTIVKLYKKEKEKQPEGQQGPQGQQGPKDQQGQPPSNKSKTPIKDAIEEDIKNSEKTDKPIYDKSKGGGDKNKKSIQVGSVVFDKNTKKYGRVTNINNISGEVDYDEISQQEAEDYRNSRKN